jgi:putative ABC transport system permease protein
MNLWRLAAKSLGYYWRTSLAVFLSVLVAAGALIGALVVGDSVQYTLRHGVDLRLGQTAFAVVPQDRYFEATLAENLSRQVGAPVAAVLQAPGTVASEDGSRRINRATVLGIDGTFSAMGPRNGALGSIGPDAIVLSRAAAAELDVAVGNEVLLRVEKPGLMPRDVPLASDADRVVAVRLRVQAIADDAAFGRFDLRANQAAPRNVFVSRTWLAAQIGQSGRANMLLAAGSAKAQTVDDMNRAMKDSWTLADSGLEMRRLIEPNVLELRSRRVFIEDPLAEAAMLIDAHASGILAYFVNGIRLGDKSTPYSMVAAIGSTGPVTPPGMRPDQIVINQWLAEDLDAKIGDKLTLQYYVLGANQELREETSDLTVARIVPLEGPAADPNLMPDFPGLADAENCRDWKPGIPINLDKIRPKDEAYWKSHRGTPKAFVTLEAGRSMWHNRFGNLTAVRYPGRPGLDGQIALQIHSRVDPAAVGLFFQPVLTQGLAAGKGGTDFGQLFLGLSMFLIGSAVILTGLLFVFGVESRASQIGLLLAVGLTPRQVRRLLMAEGGLLAAAGTLAGIGAGLLYTRLMVYGLATLWSGAVAGAPILFHANVSTLCIGGLASMVVACLAIAFALRKHISRPAIQLLMESGESTVRSPKQRHWDVLLGGVSFVGAAAAIVLSRTGGSEATAGGFFAAGALLLVGGIMASHVMLGRIAGGRARWAAPTLRSLGIRNAGRRSGRSLAIVVLLACGVFIVVAVGANRHDPWAQPLRRDSGTGGFAFYGESSIAILHDLNTKVGRDSVHLSDNDLAGASVVSFRVHDGDDASCLNLNRAQRPRLLGVQPEQLSRRGAFKFMSVAKGFPAADGWRVLSADLGDGIVPAVGDYPTVFWALGKNVGDDLQYEDQRGRPFRVRIVGMLDSSILQGSLVIAEAQFRNRFPSEAGYRAFLIDAPSSSVGWAMPASSALTSRLSDFGLVLTPTQERLAAFSQVENTYLSIFTMLGGFGLILGSVGLGLIVLRNLLERRGELAMLRAVGFSRKAVQFMVFYEHWGLVLSGIFWGVVAALVAVVPAMQSPGGQIPYVGLTVTILGIAASGAFWVWLASAVALRGPLLDALRNE